MKTNTDEVAKAISELIPSVIQGGQLQFLSESTVTHSQFLLLAAVHARTGCSMSDLAQNMHIRMPTATGLVDRLVQSGFIERVHSSSDRRKVVVCLTPKGEGFIKGFKKTIQVRWSDVLKKLSKNELMQMYGIVTKLKTELQK